VGIAVRIAGDDDVPVLVALRRAWNEESEGGPIADADFERRATSWLETEWSTRTFFLVEVDGEPVGMANLKRYERMPVAGRPSAGHWGFVGNVFVRSDRRDAGVGTALMDELITWSRANGYERLRLAPTERARPFYRRLWFEPGMVIQLNA
jgi:GNAT superfamily N-acetyltransferase